MRGILEKPMILHTAKGVVVFPSGSQVIVESSDSWYHDVQDADIREAVKLLEES